MANKLSLVAGLLLALGVSSQAAAQSKVELGATWAGKSGATNRLFNAMKDRLKEVAPQISIEVTGELDGTGPLEETIKKFDSSKDATIVLRDSGTIMLAKLPTNKPVFIGGTNDPSAYGTIANMQAPEGKITGVTYLIPKEIILRSFTSLIPDMKALTFIGDTKHPSFTVDKDGTDAACKQLKLTCSFQGVTTADEAKAITTKNPDSASAFVLMNHALLIDNTKGIVAAAGKIPTLAFGDASVKDGAVAGLVADVQKLGVMLADSIVDVMVKKKAISAVPVKTDPQPLLTINMTTVNKLGLNIPLDLLATANIVE